MHVMKMAKHGFITGVYKQKNTPITTATKSKNAALIHILLHFEADPNIINNEGLAPIHVMIMNSDLSSVLALNNPFENASVLIRDGRTLFYLAVKHWNQKIIELLLEADPKIDITYKDRKGKFTCRFNFIS